MGDVRLNRRVRLVATALARDPGWSIPHAAGSWAATKAVYRLCGHKAVSREKLLEGHYQATAARAQQEDEVLVVGDTTYLNYSHHPKTRGLGKIGTRTQPAQLQGFLVHTALAVSVSGHRVLGLLHQQTWVREEFQEAGEDRRQMRQRPRESQKWQTPIGPVSERLGSSRRAIFVYDREGDVFEVVEEMQEAAARFVIRASVNRRLDAAGEDRQYLFDSIRAEPIRAYTEVHLPSGGGRPERTARLSLRAATYDLLPPKARKRTGAPRRVNVVLAREENPPVGEAPLEWILLTSEPIATPEQIQAVLGHYCGRWKIEEYHKALKTGCRIEQRELETRERLEALLGVLSVIAWRLLALRDAARQDPKAPVQPTLTDTQCRILQRLDAALTGSSTARPYFLAIAKLGGFLGRKRDGEPGWITLWRGFSRLHDMERGYQLSRSA